MGGWWRVVRSHYRYLAALSAVTVIGVATLVVAAYDSDSFGRDLLLNLGVTVVGVVMTVLILEPLIRRSQTPDEIIHRGFPHDKFIGGVHDSNTRVRVLSAWPYVMEDPWRRQFLLGVAAAVERGVDVRMLVLDPTSQAAQQRSQDMDGSADAVRSIAEALRHIHEFRRTLPEHRRPSFQTRVYSRLPPARLYSWDRRALSSFFPLGNWRGDDIKHYETGVSSGLGSFVNEQFELLWDDSETQLLDDYMTVTLRVVSGTTSRLFDVLYCQYDGHLYVVSQPLIAHLFSLRDAPSSVFLNEARGGLRYGPTQDLVAGAIASHHEDDETQAVLEAFKRKYGDGAVQREGHVVPIRLHDGS